MIHTKDTRVREGLLFSSSFLLACHPSYFHSSLFPSEFGLFVSRTQSIRFLLPLVAMPRLSVPVETAPTDR